jgi:hypothetical protein
MSTSYFGVDMSVFEVEVLEHVFGITIAPLTE